MLTTLLLALAQGEGAPPAPESPELRLRTGAIEAPAQPAGRSSASVTRGARAPASAAARPLDAVYAPIGSLVAVRGQEDNVVMGIGLVTGLAGTGDSTEAAKQLLQNLLLTQNIRLSLQTLASKNVAVVRVEALLPAGIKPGRKLDARVSTIGDASSLAGGTLTLTELTDITGTLVYATAAGPITVGGFQAEGAGASATRNHVTVGILPDGAKVEREVPTRVASEHGYVYLDARSNHDSFGNVVRVSEAVNELYPGAAQVLPDGKSVRVRVPADLPEEAHVAYVHTILSREVRSENVARVIIDERSGVVVMGGDVRLLPGAIAHGNLTVTIAETPEVSQPGPLSSGTTERVDRTALSVDEEDGALVLVPGAVTLQEVVDVLNVLGTSPRDLISVLQAMAQSGLLLAEIRRM
jgi:flagellar P-ring protein precursor FlgI